MSANTRDGDYWANEGAWGPGSPVHKKEKSKERKEKEGARPKRCEGPALLLFFSLLFSFFLKGMLNAYV